MASSPRRTTTSSSSAVNDSEDLRRHSQELGWFGSIFGSKDQASVYFAGVLAVVALVGMVLVAVFASNFPEKGDVLKLLSGIVVAALSFLGGASGRSSKP